MSYSDRAKSNMRKQVDAQIKFLEENISFKKKELMKAMKWKKYRLPGFDTQIKRIKAGISIAQKDLSTIKARKTKLAKEGQI